jgi:uncharacterized protein (DUF433 family)
MVPLNRITVDPAVMGGKPCIRGLRVTVGAIVGLLASGKTEAEVLADYPYLEDEDLREALAFAAWRAEEVEPLLVKGPASCAEGVGKDGSSNRN